MTTCERCGRGEREYVSDSRGNVNIVGCLCGERCERCGREKAPGAGPDHPNLCSVTNGPHNPGEAFFRLDCERARGDRLERERDEALRQIELHAALLIERTRERDDARAALETEKELHIRGALAYTRLAQSAARDAEELAALRERSVPEGRRANAEATARDAATAIERITVERDEARGLLVRCGALVSGGEPRWDEAVRLVEALARVAERNRR